MQTYILKPGRQVIGRAGDMNETAVAVNIAKWVEDYPAGIAQLMVTTPGGQRIPLTVTVKDGLMVAVLPDTVTLGPGLYVYTAVMTNGGTQAQTARYECIVLGSELAQTWKPMGPRVPDWAERIFVAADVIERAMDGAIEARTTAVDKAAEAQASAEAAAASEGAAELSAQSAAARAQEASDILDDVIDQGAAQVSAIQEAGAAARESIPETYTQLSDDVSDLKSDVESDETGLALLVRKKELLSGNVVDMSNVTIKANLWIDGNPTCVLSDGTYYQNPFTTTVDLPLRFYPVDADGNAITLTRDGSTSETSIGWDNYYIKIFVVSGTTVNVYGYKSFHNFENDFKTINRTYTLSEIPHHWNIEGKAKASDTSLNVGLTYGEYSTEYVPYAPPTHVWEYTGKINELPYIDVQSSNEMTDTERMYRLDGNIYYYNGSAWARLGVYSNDDVEHVDKNVFFTSMKYNESSGAIVNAGNMARTLQYIPVDAKQIIADGTHVTGIELLAWDNAGEYIGVWDAETAAFVTTAKMSASVNLANLIELYPEYKYKINASINGIDAYTTSNYVSWVYSSSDNADRIADTLDGVMAFDCSAINVVDNTNISGANGLAYYDINFVSTDYVDISERIGNTIKFNCSIVANPIGFSIYDKGKRWISGLWGNAQTLPNYGYVSDRCPQRITWTVPDDAYYLRATMRKDWYTQPDDFGIAFYRINRQSTGADDAEFITIAHKGYGFSQIENTLQSFINAGEIGFKAVEIDCRKMADGVYIANHSASATLYSNGTGESVTFASANWGDIKGKTIDAQGLYPLATVEQIFSTLRKYAVKYYIIDLKTGSNAEIIDIARRCGVVDRLLLSYYNASSLIADIDLLKAYPNIPIRFTPSLTNEQYQTVRGEITNQFFADINATEAGNTYIPNALSWGIPILFSGATETSKLILGPVAAGAMANLTLQYSPAELTAMASLNYSQFPTLTASAQSASLSTGSTATITVASSIDDPACYVYGYSDDLDVFSVAQTAYGANASFTLSKVGDGTANFIAFTATGEQIVIPVTVT